jgi:hypothetical protein
MLDFIEVGIYIFAFCWETEPLIFAVGNADQISFTGVVTYARPCIAQTCSVHYSLIFSKSFLGKNLEIIIIILALLREAMAIGCVVIDSDTNFISFTCISVTSFSLSDTVHFLYIVLRLLLLHFLQIINIAILRETEALIFAVCNAN